MATTAIQTNCDRCKRPIVAGASYCDACGTRTRQARRMVSTVLRIELIVLVAMAVLTMAFTISMLR